MSAHPLRYRSTLAIPHHPHPPSQTCNHTTTHRLVQDGTLHPDGSQVAAVQALHILQGVLAAQVAEEAAADAAADAPAAFDATPSAPAPSGGADGAPAAHPAGVQGAYMWGPVGRGKTTIMDLFARTMPPSVIVKRHHIDTLLAHVNERCHQLEAAAAAAGGSSSAGRGALKPSQAAAPTSSSSSDDDADAPRSSPYGAAAPQTPVQIVATDLAESCHLLCIDKLRVAGPAEANTISQLLAEILRSGCWVAFTVGDALPLG